MNKLSFFSLILAASTCLSAFCAPKKGTVAPEAHFVDQSGTTIKLSECKGKKVALVFLPSTAGWSIHCKAQACSIKTGLDELEDYGIKLICASADSQEKLEKFIKKNEVNFPLLHASKKVINAYGVNALVGIKRYTFLINEEGIIVKIITDVDVDNHAQQIIDSFAAIK